ncbi:MAG: hypothetical protein ABEJ99_05695 [Candidatus Nanohaloarchaea archaeon]
MSNPVSFSPTRVEEKVKGYDVGVGGGSKLLFFQFKRPKEISPYKFQLRPKERKQLMTLWINFRPGEAYYAFPCANSVTDLKDLTSKTLFVDAWDILFETTSVYVTKSSGTVDKQFEFRNHMFSGKKTSNDSWRWKNLLTKINGCDRGIVIEEGEDDISSRVKANEDLHPGVGRNFFEILQELKNERFEERYDVRESDVLSEKIDQIVERQKLLTDRYGLNDVNDEKLRRELEKRVFKIADRSDRGMRGRFSMFDR